VEKEIKAEKEKVKQEKQKSKDAAAAAKKEVAKEIERVKEIMSSTCTTNTSKQLYEKVEQFQTWKCEQRDALEN